MSILSRQYIIISTILLFATSLYTQAQGNITVDYTGCSDLKDSDGNKLGSGSMSHIGTDITIPVNIKYNERKQMTLWGIRLNADFAHFDCSENARMYSPHEIINTGIMLVHLRPINEKWSIIAGLGVGIYAPTNYIKWKSILANGRLVFAYKLHSNLSVGAGAGLTNSFGIPMILPMVYVNWSKKGKYEFSVNFMGRLKLTAATWLSPKWKLTCNAIDMSGMSAVMSIDGKTKLYSTSTIRSDLKASYYINRHFSVYGAIGGVWRRTSFICNREISEMFDHMFSSHDKQVFSPAIQVQTGISYEF